MASFQMKVHPKSLKTKCSSKGHLSRKMKLLLMKYKCVKSTRRTLKLIRSVCLRAKEWYLALKAKFHKQIDYTKTLIWANPKLHRSALEMKTYRIQLIYLTKSSKTSSKRVKMKMIKITLSNIKRSYQLTSTTLLHTVPIPKVSIQKGTKIAELLQTYLFF